MLIVFTQSILKKKFSGDNVYPSYTFHISLEFRLGETESRGHSVLVFMTEYIFSSFLTYDLF